MRSLMIVVGLLAAHTLVACGGDCSDKGLYTCNVAIKQTDCPKAILPPSQVPLALESEACGVDVYNSTDNNACANDYWSTAKCAVEKHYGSRITMRASCSISCSNPTAVQCSYTAEATCSR